MLQLLQEHYPTKYRLKNREILNLLIIVLKKRLTGCKSFFDLWLSTKYAFHCNYSF